MNIKQKRPNKKWTHEEESWLIKNYNHTNIKYCCEYLNRKRMSVMHKCMKLGLTDKKEPRWSLKEIEILKAEYFNGGTIICKDLLNRTPLAIRNEAMNLGLSVKEGFPKKLELLNVDYSHIYDIISPEISYILGFLWADGHVAKDRYSIQTNFAISDFPDLKEILYKFSNWNERIIKYNEKNPNLQNQISLILFSKELRDFLAENDYLIKSGASADKILSKIPEHLKHYWWRGYFDGDGCIYNKNYFSCIAIASCYQQDWSFTEKLFKQLLITYKIEKRISKQGKSSIVWAYGFDDVSRFCDYIYQGDQFGLKRKYDIYQKFLLHKKTVFDKKSSKFLGVYFNKNWNKYVAYCFYEKRNYIIGKFNLEIDAALARDNYVKNLNTNRKFKFNFPTEII